MFKWFWTIFLLGAPDIWSQQALVSSISVPGWIFLRGEWRLYCIPLSEITKLRVELVKYARKKGYAKKSDNRERQSQTLFSITSTRLHEVSSHSRSPRYHLFFFDILYHSQSRVKFSNGLYMMKIVNWVYTLYLKKILKKTSRHKRSLKFRLG